jgi:hypothetical protein
MNHAVRAAAAAASGTETPTRYAPTSTPCATRLPPVLNLLFYILVLKS